MRGGPQPIIDEGAGYWMMLSGSPSADLNVALVTSAEPTTLVGVLEQVIASGFPTLFMVGGDCRSTEIPGSWQHVGDMPFMSLDLDSADIYTDSRVRQATEDDVDDVCSVMGEAFGLSTALLHDPIAHALSDITGPMKIWLLVQDNIAVSCVVTSPIGDAVTVWCMSTPERFARRGYGRAILADVMQRSRADGATLGLLGATPPGEPLYESTGWITLEHWRIFANVESTLFDR
jgi:hypothetical protein